MYTVSYQKKIGGFDRGNESLFEEPFFSISRPCEGIPYIDRESSNAKLITNCTRSSVLDSQRFSITGTLKLDVLLSCVHYGIT